MYNKQDVVFVAMFVLFVLSVIANVCLLSIVTATTTFRFDSCTAKALNDVGKLVWECIKNP